NQAKAALAVEEQKLKLLKQQAKAKTESEKEKEKKPDAPLLPVDKNADLLKTLDARLKALAHEAELERQTLDGRNKAFDEYCAADLLSQENYFKLRQSSL